MIPSKGRSRRKVKQVRAPATRRGLRSQIRHRSVEGLTDAVVNPGGHGVKDDTYKSIDHKTISLSSAANGRPDLVMLGEEMAPRVEDSDITIPPWSINLVGLGDECRFNHIDIPQSITYSYVSVSPHVRAVSAETASTLLRQIAGLTSIATEQSLKARDEILKLKREKEVALKGKDEEIVQLRKELNHMNYGNGHNKSVQEKHVVGKQELRLTGFSPFTDNEGDTSSEGKNTDVMSDSSSDDDGDVSNQERVFGWLPTNAAGWKVATRERDNTCNTLS